MRTSDWFLPVVALSNLVGLAACNSSMSTPEDNPELTDMATSALAREENPNVSSDDKGALVKGMSAFAFDLASALTKDSSMQSANFACSPLSVSLALSMTYAGAGGDTATQMKSVLHVTQDPGAYYRALDWLTLSLDGRASEALADAQQSHTHKAAGTPAPNPDDYQFQLVSSLWTENTLAFKKSFLDTLSTSFGTSVYLADFLGKPDTERTRINSWVSAETKNKINDLLPDESVTTNTRAVLVNALHMKLPWERPFEKGSTVTAPFTLADGTTADAHMMRSTMAASYAEDDALQAVALRLRGGSVELLVFVPKSGTTLASLETGSLAAEVQTLTSKLSRAEVSVSLPRFHFTTDSIELSTPLKTLGMTDAFDGAKADFSAMTTKDAPYLTSVYHKAMVGVDEAGVEASAATAARMMGVSAPIEIKEVKADHPFFFGIYDKNTATWLFLGHVVHPD